MDLLQEVWLQWGMVGLIIAAALYIIWENFKRNKELEKTYLEKTPKHHSVEDNNVLLQQLWDAFNKFGAKMNKMEEMFKKRLDELEARVDKSHPAHIDEESHRFEITSKVAPTIHTVLSNYVHDCQADHILLAMMHNGTKSLTGISYFKFDIIAEKFFPLHNPQDEEMSPKYKDVDITLHNKLPMTVMQNRGVYFNIEEEGCPLEAIDEMLYIRCKARGIRHIAFDPIRDMKNVVIGFVCAYNFTDDLINTDQLIEASDTLKQIYITSMETD